MFSKGKSEIVRSCDLQRIVWSVKVACQSPAVSWIHTWMLESNPKMMLHNNKSNAVKWGAGMKTQHAVLCVFVVVDTLGATQHLGEHAYSTSIGSVCIDLRCCSEALSLLLLHWISGVVVWQNKVSVFRGFQVCHKNSLWSSCFTSSPPPRSQTHHSLLSSTMYLLFSPALPLFLTSFTSPLFFFFPILPPYALKHFFFFFLPTFPSLSLIELAGALIKCSSRPPPVGLGRALIPSPVPEALKSTARENGSFFNFFICIILRLHSHMLIRVEDELICRMELHIGIIIIQSSRAAWLYPIIVTIRDQWIAVVIAVKMSSLSRPASSSLLFNFAFLIIISN